MNINRVLWLEGERERQFSHFYPKEYEALLAHFGFGISEMLGDPQGGAYRPDSRNLILVCQLKSTRRP